MFVQPDESDVESLIYLGILLLETLRNRRHVRLCLLQIDVWLEATGDDQIAPRVSLSRGIQGYLVKPFKRELVVGAVKDAVQWHQVAAKSTKPAAGPDPVDTWLQGRAGRPPKND